MGLIGEGSRCGDTSGSPDDASAGRGVPRREDRALLIGRAEFTDDRSGPRTAHLAFVRSQHAHARIEAVDTTPAATLDGVLGVFTWGDLEQYEDGGWTTGTVGR